MKNFERGNERPSSRDGTTKRVVQQVEDKTEPRENTSDALQLEKRRHYTPIQVRRQHTGTTKRNQVPRLNIPKEASMDSAHRRNKQEDEGQSGPTAKAQSSRDFGQQPHEPVQRTNKTAHGILHDSLGEHTDIAPPKTTSYPKPSSQNYSTQTPLDKDRRSTRRNQNPPSC